MAVFFSNNSKYSYNETKAQQNQKIIGLRLKKIKKNIYQWFNHQIQTKPFLSSTIYFFIDVSLKLAHAFTATARMLMKAIPGGIYLVIVGQMIKSLCSSEKKPFGQDRSKIALSLSYLLFVGLIVLCSFLAPPGFGLIFDSIMAAGMIFYHELLYQSEQDETQKALHSEKTQYSIGYAAFIILISAFPAASIPLTISLIITNLLFMACYNNFRKHLYKARTPDSIDDGSSAHAGIEGQPRPSSIHAGADSTSSHSIESSLLGATFTPP